MKENDIQGIKAVSAIPVPWDVVTEAGMRKMLSKGIASIRQEFKDLPKKGFIPVAKYPILINLDPTARLFVEDVNRLHVIARSTNYKYSLGAGFKMTQPPLGKDEHKKLPEKMEWRLCSQGDAQHLVKDLGWTDFGITAHQGKNKKIKGIAFAGGERFMYLSGTVRSTESSGADTYIADLWVCGIPEKTNSLAYLLENGMVPNFGPEKEAFWSSVQQLYRLGALEILCTKERGYSISWKNAGVVLDKMALGKITQIGHVVVSEEELNGCIQQVWKQETLSPEERAQSLKSLLQRDMLRADITEYPERILEDPNLGSWDLWETECRGLVNLESGASYYARNPKLDISQNGVIGIDFGTKSTVVVCMEDNEKIYPLRIGMGRYEQEPKASDYENPTVMQFVDIDKFMQAYQKKGGRPFTYWSDLCISHTAFHALNENENTENYFSFFSELKQWAGTLNRRVRIRDHKHEEINLPPYGELSELDCDPIELYAYYIGLYINNMHTRKIYLRYLLSFPVTYAKSVRNRILNSFKNGLEKSLPEAILGDSECMERFSVEEGVGEPAAYAVCALQAFHIIPKKKEKIVYGVFDFGGGTTDFDFGIWRKAEGVKERRYRYVIHHFGDGGDQYLGGENLLGLMAYHVFKDNQKILRQSGITFSLPPQCERFAGSEYLISESQEAQTNTRLLMERLRPLWEQSEGYEKMYANGVLKLRLFGNNGDKYENFELVVDAEKLTKLLRQRIEAGVQEFFHALLAVCKDGKNEELKDCNRIHIFLAGNSCKSKIVQELFREAVRTYSERFEYSLQRINAADKCMAATVAEDEESDYFKLFYPLGTPEADEQMGISDEEDFERPTGKTGVAIGLVQCREGSQIKVITEKSDTDEDEIRFRFWIGYNEDDYFKYLLHRESRYGEWEEFWPADLKYFEFQYTTAPTAELDHVLPITDQEVKTMRLTIPKSAVNEDYVICLRPTGPTELEYTVAESKDQANQGEYVCEPVKIVLE